MKDNLVDFMSNENTTIKTDVSKNIFILIARDQVDGFFKLTGVFHDLANLKRIIQSNEIIVNEDNFYTFINKDKRYLLETLKELFDKKKWENIFLYYTGHSRIVDGELVLPCNREENVISDDPDIKFSELRKLLELVESNLILFFDCCHAERIFKDIWYKDIFILTATGRDETAKEVRFGGKSTGVFTYFLVKALEEGIENKKAEITLLDTYLFLVEKIKTVVRRQTPRMLTTNLVQHIVIGENKKHIEKESRHEELGICTKDEIKKMVSKNKIKEAINQLERLARNDIDFSDKIVSIKSRYIMLDDQIILGIIDSNIANIENNKIVQSLLKLINQKLD